VKVGSGEQSALRATKHSRGHRVSHHPEHLILVEPVEAHQQVEEGREPRDGSNKDHPVGPEDPAGFREHVDPIRPVDQVVERT
jgi:hypothetical protein